MLDKILLHSPHSNNSENKDSDNSYAFINEQVSKKIHPAVEYFHQLQRLEPSFNLKKLLSSFNEIRPINSETFIEGVKKFIGLANSNPLDNTAHAREALYGNIYSGLHYSSHLIESWNSSHPKKALEATKLRTLAPGGWDSIYQDEYYTLIYRGQEPAEALDDLVKGPTVIDCGMFAQLGLWFGIRYLLGNKRFNQCFGRAPFFITQCVYNGIEHSDQPYSGNPLYSFLSTKEQAIIPSVTVKYSSNTSLYDFKHPEGTYNGENCILISDQYYIFDPYLAADQGFTKSEVLNLLRNAFNENITQYEQDTLSLFAENPDKVDPWSFLTYGQLIKAAENLRDTQLTEEEFLGIEQVTSAELTFDLDKFLTWLQAMENQAKVDQVEYLPQTIDYSLMPSEFLDRIPFENKTSMDFSKFKQETPQQKELIVISKQFCQSVVRNESKLVILTGKAGVGKTASAVCAAKELTARGKKVIWISEVMVNGWLDQAESIADLNIYCLEIDKLLKTNPDAVFLDDDNLAGFSGKILLERIYSWYVRYPGKGLFITSNQPICFKECYGNDLEKYHYPPFTPYNSPRYLNWQCKTDLAGESLRTHRDGQSIGAIVSNLMWKSHEGKLEDVELIPAFDGSKELVPICESLRKTGRKGNAYDKLRPIQQQWIHEHKVDGFVNDSGRYEEPYLTVTPLKFEKTQSKTIALEIRQREDDPKDPVAQYNREFKKKFNINILDEICPNSIDQLIRVLNYAHDQGGRRVILINQTNFNHEQLLIEIKAQLPESERERTWSRLMLLLCETEDSIFKYEQFNGRIENTWLDRHVVNKDKRGGFFGETNHPPKVNEQLCQSQTGFPARK